MKRQTIHHNLYVLLTAALCISIPLSKFAMSVCMLLLAVNWLAEWNWSEKWQRLKENKSAFFALLFGLVLCLGFIKASDCDKAFNYYIAEFPLFIAPCIAASSTPFSKKELKFILGGFVLSTIFASIYSTIYYIYNEVVNIREISIFISHIRFSLCIDISIVFLLFYILKDKEIKMAIRIILIIATLWLITYLFIAQTFTGILLLLLVAFIYTCFLLIKQRKQKRYKVIGFSLFALFVIFIGYSISITYNYFHIDQNEYLTLDEKTINGNIYENDLTSLVENGSLTGVYVCKDELRTSWKQRSGVEYDEASIEPTLIRYLNSCHFRKDSVGVMSLNHQDISNIENHIANISYTKKYGLERAAYPIFFSFQLYEREGYINNSTIFQRLEYWKAAWKQACTHPLFGVGLGNHKTAVAQQLEADNSQLDENLRCVGCHNQWLTFWLMGGIFVLMYFIFTLVYPFIEQKRKMTFVYVAFFIILVGSMFTEDTLEMQAGMTLFAIINSILLYCFNPQYYENL